MALGIGDKSGNVTTINTSGTVNAVSSPVYYGNAAVEFNTESGGSVVDTNGQIEFTIPSGEIGGGDFTIESFISVSKLGGGYNHADFFLDLPALGYRIKTTTVSGKIGFSIRKPDLTSVSGGSSGTITDETYVHFMLTRESGTIKFYAFGSIQQASLETGNTHDMGGDSVELGDLGGPQTALFRIDSFRISDTVRNSPSGSSYTIPGSDSSVDNVGSDTIFLLTGEISATLSGSMSATVNTTANFSSGLKFNVGANISSDAQLTCDAGVEHTGSTAISTDFASSITSAVTHDFDISGVTVTYVESYDAYTTDDYVATGYFDDGIYIPADYVETQSFTGVIQQQPSDAQLTVIGGFDQSGEATMAVDCEVTVSGEARPSLQGEVIISSDHQITVSADNVFGPVTSTMDTDTDFTLSAGLLLEVGGANYYNRYAEEGYTTPETDLTDFDSDTELTASAIRLAGIDGILESASVIQIEGGYLVSQGSLLLNGDAEFSINQTAGTSAGLILSAESNVTADAETSIDALYIRGITQVNYTADTQFTPIPGYLLGVSISIDSDSQLTSDSNIIPAASLIANIDSQLVAVGGFLKDLEAAIQANGFALTVAQYKIVDPFRTIRVKSETRIINVPQENRLYTIDDENRVNKVTQEIRSYIVPQEIRQIKAQHLILDRGLPVGSNERRIG